jgi:DNA primase
MALQYAGWSLELQPWKASIDIEHPDVLVFDLDPGEGVEWKIVIQTALKLRRMLRDQGLEPWPKLTGGKRLHLMAPLDDRRTTTKGGREPKMPPDQPLGRRDRRRCLA